MIVDSSAATLRTEIAKSILSFALGSIGGEEVALDLAELIALRVPTATDDEVATIGFYVRANLVVMGRGAAPYCEVLHYLTNTAVVAGLGPVALKQSIEAGLEGLCGKE